MHTEIPPIVIWRIEKDTIIKGDISTGKKSVEFMIGVGKLDGLMRACIDDPHRRRHLSVIIDKLFTKAYVQNN